MNRYISWVSTSSEKEDCCGMNASASEHWLTEGDCKKCRRQHYCSKPCTRNKRRTNTIVSSIVTSYMDEATGGAFSAIMNQSNY